MAEGKHCGKLELSRCDVRVRCVLRRLGVDTAEKLLSLTEAELSGLKNCGAKTIAKIMRLQEDYGKEASFAKEEQETVDRAAENGLMYMNRLVIVAIAANGVIEGAEKSGSYYFRVSRQRFNALKESLEALRKQRQ